MPVSWPKGEAGRKKSGKFGAVDTVCMEGLQGLAGFVQRTGEPLCGEVRKTLLAGGRSQLDVTSGGSCSGPGGRLSEEPE